MKTYFIFQEILVVINTKFSSEEYLAKEEDKDSGRTQTERPAEACWNGMLPAKLPEISIVKNNKPLTVWELNEGKHLLCLKPGETDERPDALATINPYRLIVSYN